MCWRYGIGCWYVRSFEMKFSDGNEPPFSDIVENTFQNSLSVRRDGSDDDWALADDSVATASAEARARRRTETIMGPSTEGNVIGYLTRRIARWFPERKSPAALLAKHAPMAALSF